MDIIAHGLWTRAAFRGATLKYGRQFNIWAAVIWGIAPDLFAFALPSIWMLWALLTGQWSVGDIPRPHSGMETTPAYASQPMFLLSYKLYNISHSAVVFIFCFLVVYLIRRRVYWEMLAWFGHILIDIPTHTYKFYPTPVFWPLWGWKFSGIQWGVPWFMILNYGVMALVYIFLWHWRKKREEEKITQDI